MLEHKHGILTVLGWSNPMTAGGSNLRLYALDEGTSPRWATDGGRTIERAILSSAPSPHEGTKYVVIPAQEFHDLLANIWDEAAEETAEWMSNQSSPSGIPHDPPRNPYETES